MRPRSHSDTQNGNMYHTIAFTLTLMVVGQCVANPVADPDPGHHHTRIRIHVPHEVHTLHHHHVETVPIYKPVPYIKEVPIFKEVPVIKTVPVLKTVPVPVVHTVAVEKPVFLPIHSVSHWH